MNPLIASAGINMAGQLAGNALNTSTWKDNQSWLLNRQFDQWQKQVDYLNYYNSPVNQIGRLQSAGINPALAFTNGVNNTSSTSASIGGVAPTGNASFKGVSPLEIQQMRTSQEQLKGQKIANEIAEEELEQKRIETDEKKQSHITNVYANQNAFRLAVAQGGFNYNPNFSHGWRDRSGAYMFVDTPSYGMPFGDFSLGKMLDANEYYRDFLSPGASALSIQYDPSLLSGYQLGRMYHDFSQKEYNTHVSDESRIKMENQRDELNALLNWTNVNGNFADLTQLFGDDLKREMSYKMRTFDAQTQAAIAEFKEILSRNTLLDALHQHGMLGNEAPLLRFFSDKTGHAGFDSLYSAKNYGLLKADAMLNALIQVGADVAGAYLSRGAHRPFDVTEIRNGSHLRRTY